MPIKQIESPIETSKRILERKQNDVLVTISGIANGYPFGHRRKLRNQRRTRLALPRVDFQEIDIIPQPIPDPRGEGGSQIRIRQKLRESG